MSITRFDEGRLAFLELVGSEVSDDPLDHVLRVKYAHATSPELLRVGMARDDYDKLVGAFSVADITYDGSGRFDKVAYPTSALTNNIQLFPHQKDAVDKIVEKDGNLLLSHPVGSGKTLTSIAAFERLKDEGKAQRALVVTPASLRTNYLENGVKKFTTARGAIFGNEAEISAGTHVSLDKPDPKAAYHIVSYDMYRKNPQQYIRAAGADTVIYDELHKAKNEGVKTTDAIKDARPHHRNFIGMTGSLVSNSPADIVPLVDAMTNGKHMLGRKANFESRFVDVNPQTGARSLRNEMVLRAMIAPYVHHVDQAQLQTNAPKKVVEEVHVEMSPQQHQLYRYIKKELDPVTAVKFQLGGSHINGAELNDVFARLIRLRQVSNSVHTVDHSVTLEESAVKTPKVKKLLDDVEDHINETPDAQVVIHTNLIHGGVDVLQAGLKQRGIQHATFIGKGNEGVNEKSRQEGVADFRAGKKKVLVLSAAGSEGLDLPNTTMMCMMDGHYNPERINQAEARGIRAGGLAHRAPENRRVVVRRYMSVSPKDTSRGAEVAYDVWANISPSLILQRMKTPGMPVFYNPFEHKKTTDEWVYDVANRKAELNKSLYENIKKGEAALPEFGTHEELEEWLGFDKVAGPGLAALGGALLGAAYGGYTAPKGELNQDEKEHDPNKRFRGAAGHVLGGALGGAMTGYAIAKSPTLGLMGGLSAAFAPFAGHGIADLLAKPKRHIPDSIREVLGPDKVQYTDRELFKKYWDTFGHDLENKGLEADVDNKHEAKFVRALHDIYQEGKKDDSKWREYEKSRGQVVEPSKAKFLKGHGVGLATAAGAVPLLSLLAPPELRGAAALSAVPTSVLLGTSVARGYRDLFVDPHVAVASRAEARRRSQFDDEQLRKLLRGLPVEEVKIKQHVIK